VITPEIKQIIDLYQKSGIDIQTVTWPFLNSQKAEFQFYYAGQIISINDCFHRARAQAEFAAAVDLDELIYLPNKTLLIDILSKIEINSAGARLTRAHAQFSTYPVYSSDPKLLSFSALSAIEGNPLASAVPKLVVRPEQVRLSHVHWVTEREKGSVNEITVPLADATLLHIRTIPNKVHQKNQSEISIMTEMAQIMAINWNRRFLLSDTASHRLHFSRNFTHLAKIMHDCMLKVEILEAEMCYTNSRCSTVMMNEITDWLYAEGPWMETKPI
jgi:hypothetical protein